jgi:hypothetical protein
MAMSDTALVAECSFDVAETYFAENNIEDALAHHAEAVRLGLDADRGALNRWMCLMMLGRFEEAWKETDRTEEARRARDDSTRDLPPHMRRVWNGKCVADNRVLVRCYHGLGDTIQFARYIPVLKRVARSVIVQCQPSLVSLIESVPGIDELIPFDCYARDEPIDVPFDVDIEMMELPYAFRTTLASIPGAEPYLHVSEAIVKSQRMELTAMGLNSNQLNVGLVWSSGNWNPERSMTLSELKRLTTVPGVKLFSLQHGPAVRQMNACREWIKACSTNCGCEVVLTTAATILSLDLIISVDTMVAHLAGALGKPVWTLLPYSADWRWMTGRDDSPWYPTMRLFRQPKRGDWTCVVEHIVGELSRLRQTSVPRVECSTIAAN